MTSDRNVSQLLALSLAKQENKKFTRCFCKAKGSGEKFPGEDVLRVQSSLNVSPFQPSGMFKTIVSSPVFGCFVGSGCCCLWFWLCVFVCLGIVVVVVFVLCLLFLVARNDCLVA